MLGDDDLIDAVAREMTRGEPSARMRSAIRQQMTVPARVQRGRGWLPLPVWAAACVAVAVVLFISVRSLSGPGVEPLRSTHLVTVLHVPPPVALRPALEALAVNRVETSARGAGRRGTPQRIVVAPLVIEPLSVPQMAVSTSSGVMPIEIDPLQIEPLRSE
jgi:hypothetical protein